MSVDQSCIRAMIRTKYVHEVNDVTKINEEIRIKVRL